MAGYIGKSQGVVQSDGYTRAEATDKFADVTGGTFTGPVDFDTTSHITLPVGTTAERPAAPTEGMIRQNSTTGEPEWYSADVSEWIPFSEKPTYTVEYLVLAGGGGTPNPYISNSVAKSGGGGAGGYVQGSMVVSAGETYTAVVGAGGAGTTGVDTGGQGGDSSLTGVATTAVGGGGGGRQSRSGADGGSGGGGGADGPGNGGAGTTGQGNVGGAGIDGSNGGGGGGASGVGGTPAHGGAGKTWFDGVGRGGGGGGGPGGTATYGGAEAYYDAPENRGGGGGGIQGNATGLSGGSGIVALRYLGPQRGTGGTVTSSEGFTYHHFYSSGTFTA